MTRVDFYVHAGDRLDVARRVATKAWRSGLRVFVYAPDNLRAAELDRRLWIGEDTAFVPHCRAGDGTERRSPIVIGTEPQGFVFEDLIVNLHDAPPECFARFHRLVEVVSTDPEDVAKGRSRYRYYQDRGYALNLNDLAAQAVP